MAYDCDSMLQQSYYPNAQILLKLVYLYFVANYLTELKKTFIDEL